MPNSNDRHPPLESHIIGSQAAHKHLLGQSAASERRSRPGLTAGPELFLAEYIGGAWHGEGTHLRGLKAEDWEEAHKMVGPIHGIEYYHAIYTTAWAEAIAEQLATYGVQVKKLPLTNDRARLSLSLDDYGMLRSGLNADHTENKFRHDKALHGALVERLAKARTDLKLEDLERPHPAPTLPVGERHR